MKYHFLSSNHSPQPTYYQSLSNEGEKKKKINSNIIYNIMLITSKNFKWHDDQTLTWNIKDIKLKFQQELSKTLLNTIDQGNALCKLKF